MRKIEKKMQKPYFACLMTLGSFHELFLESIRAELGRRRIRNLSSIQCLAIYTMGKSSLEGKSNIAYEELYGLYQLLASLNSLTYILRKFMKSGHIIPKYSDTEKRRKVYALSEKGLVL